MAEEKIKAPRKKITVGQIIGLVIAVAVMIFVVFQLVILIKYTLGQNVNVNQLWLYQWVVNIGK